MTAAVRQQPGGGAELDDTTLPAWLVSLGLEALRGVDAATLHVEPAGDGNINRVRRVRAPGGRTWIVKHARPALERFPQYAADPARVVVEARWLALAATVDDTGICPRLLHVDEAAHALVLEDVGPVERLDASLERGAWPSTALAALGRFLGRVHRATAGLAGSEPLPNDDLQRLHGEHVFLLPFVPNDFGLAPPVRALAERVWADAGLRDLARAAHGRYREPHGALVHGDVQPANVLLPPGGPRLLDAEIAHVGDPAFDPGILLGHLVLAAAAHDTDAPAVVAASALWEAYAAEAPPVAFADVARYAGIEAIRRTIGAARVPLSESMPAAARMLAAGSALVRTPPSTPAGLARTLQLAREAA